MSMAWFNENQVRGLVVLLGAACASAMLSGARAAELEDGSAPVPFVKICTHDGHSYSYIPGGDACSSGLALTIGTDDRRSKSLMNLPPVGASRLAGQPNAGEPWPDPVVSLRTDQAWGYGALVGGVHNLNTAYTGDSSILSSSSLGRLNTCLQAGSLDCGRAKDNPGYFVGIEGEMKAPLFGAGDRIGAGIRFSQGGASGFGGSLNLATPDLFGAANSSTTNFDSGAGLELTKAWSVQAGYDHQWSPGLNTSLFAGYSNIGVDTGATNYVACGGNGAAASAGCKSSWDNVGAGLRTSWAPASGLTLSVQTMYNYVWSGFSGGTSFGGVPAAGRPPDAYSFANQGVWSSYLRINRTFNTGD